MKEAIEFLTELEGALPPHHGCHHHLFVENGKLGIYFIADLKNRWMFLQPEDLERTPAEIVAEIVRTIR